MERPNQPLLSIVLPAYEEGSNLKHLLPELQRTARTLTSSFEILVIDTQTPRDETPEVCAQHGVRYFAREDGELYGHAIRTAVKYAKGVFVFLMDADGSHNPSVIPDLWRQRESSDLIIASRYVKGGKTENPAVLIFLSLCVNLVFRYTLGLQCYDVSNSFRLYKGDDFRALHLQCDHFDIVEEILVKLVASRSPYRIKEVPFVFERRKEGKTKRNLVTFAVGYLATLIRMLKIKRQAEGVRGRHVKGRAVALTGAVPWKSRGD